jgi:hypothetical protein
MISGAWVLMGVLIWFMLIVAVCRAWTKIKERTSKEKKDK